MKIIGQKISNRHGEFVFKKMNAFTTPSVYVIRNVSKFKSSLTL